MKNVSLILIAMALAVTMVLAPPSVQAQSLPDDPSSAGPAARQSQPAPKTQAPRPDAFWLRVQQIARGQQVTVTSTYGPPLRCLFAGATDDYLFCDPPGSPAGTGYGFERATVLDVKVVPPPHNWHPGVLSAMIGGGLIVGIAATAQTDAGHAAEAGLIGALVTGAIAAPFVLLPPPPPQPYAFGAGIAFRPRRFGRPLRFIPAVHH